MTPLTKLHSWWLRTWFSLHGVRIGQRCRLEPRCSIERGFSEGRRGEVRLEDDCHLMRGAHLHAWGGNISLGNKVFVGNHAVLYGQGGITIGDSSLISMHCRILSSNHAIPPQGTDIRSQPDAKLPTHIGRDVWLGAGVAVLGGVTIGDGCVVGAGAVVAGDLPPGSVAMGIPARVVRHRE
jgi:acetyltransferase-like isoleucine patch superfamily enzyme